MWLQSPYAGMSAPLYAGAALGWYLVYDASSSMVGLALLIISAAGLVELANRKRFAAIERSIKDIRNHLSGDQ